MSTVNKQAAESVISGLYKEDGFDSIIIYGNMFGNIAFKLCKGHNNLETNRKTFMRNGWPYAVGSTDTDTRLCRNSKKNWITSANNILPRTC